MKDCLKASWYETSAVREGRIGIFLESETVGVSRYSLPIEDAETLSESIRCSLDNYRRTSVQFNSSSGNPISELSRPPGNDDVARDLLCAPAQAD